MTEITKQEYISLINNYELLYLVGIESEKIYLRADIEYGGDVGLRIEQMNFELNTYLPFSEANSNCRGNYCGGIRFIEYCDEIEANQRIISDFLKLGNKPIYLKCCDDDIKNVINSYPDEQAYIVITAYDKRGRI